MKQYLFVFSLMLSACLNMAHANEEKIFSFENGNEVRWFSKSAGEIAIYDKEGKKISGVFPIHDYLTKNYSNRYTITTSRSDSLFMSLVASRTLVIIDQDGKEHSLKVPDSYLQSSVQVSDDEVVLMGTEGNLYKVSLARGEILETLKVSKKRLESIRKVNKKLLFKESVFSYDKIYLANIEGAMSIDKTINLKNVLGISSELSEGNSAFHFFNNGNGLFLSKEGKGIFFDEDLNYKVVSTGKNSQKWPIPFEVLDAGHVGYINDKFDLVIFSDDGGENVFKINAEDLKVKDAPQKELEIKNIDKGCIKEYVDYIQEIKKYRLGKNILLGVITILNPPVGIGSILISSNDYFTKRTPEEHAVSTVKILNDALERNASPEILLMTSLLNQARPEKYASSEEVMAELSNMNNSLAVCKNKKGEFGLYTIKNMIMMMLK